MMRRRLSQILAPTKKASRRNSSSTTMTPAAHDRSQSQQECAATRLDKEEGSSIAASPHEEDALRNPKAPLIDESQSSRSLLDDDEADDVAADLFVRFGSGMPQQQPQQCRIGGDGDIPALARAAAPGMDNTVGGGGGRRSSLRRASITSITSGRSSQQSMSSIMSQLSDYQREDGTTTTTLDEIAVACEPTNFGRAISDGSALSAKPFRPYRRPSFSGFLGQRRESECSLLEEKQAEENNAGGCDTGEPAARILIVDDSRVNRQLLSRLCSKLGHETRTAEDGTQALEILIEYDFDLVLLDMFMPNMNGDEVLRRMMGSEELRHVPVIMISASESTGDIARCIEMGAADYLPKPFDHAIFRARVRACLQTKRMRDMEQRYLRRIERERNRADNLLHNMLPRRIAEELKTTKTVMPRRHDDVAVFFLDIVGFTAFCNDRDPEEVVSMLSALFGELEEIAEYHAVDKTKTIGDCFMASCGLLESVDNPVRNCVSCAFAMIEAARTLIPLDVRIGIHVGPVVAGVVGRKHSLFDFFGDTVNTAQRVESNGVVGGVTLSDDALAYIKGECEYEALGEVEAKGKGRIRLNQVKKLHSRGHRDVLPS